MACTLTHQPIEFHRLDTQQAKRFTQFHEVVLGWERNDRDPIGRQRVAEGGRVSWCDQIE